VQQTQNKNILDEANYEDMIELVNQVNGDKSMTWSAQLNEKFRGYTLNQLKTATSQHKTPKKSFLAKTNLVNFAQVSESD
jgi:hypothetical protein